ncbi:MAG: hypothetical protein GXP26_09755 [Planctomycetes bacterium]|nr:hypothetical protein [Planctomycetota bacterium]
MKYRSGKFLLCITMCMVWTSSSDGAFGSNLDEDLRRLRVIRNGKQTDFRAVEVVEKELLKKYTAEDDLGRIYYELSNLYAQSGLVHRDRVVQYADKALRLLKDPRLRLRLYVYGGDSIRNDKAIEDPGKRRKQALEFYLTGLAEIQDLLDLQEEPSEVPSVNNIEDLKKLAQAGPEEFDKVRKARVRNFKRDRLLKEMHIYRDVLIRQSASLYHKFPGDCPDELESAMKLAGINPDHVGSIHQNINTYKRENPLQPPQVDKRNKANGN